MTRSRSLRGTISWRGWGPVSAPRSFLPRISRGGMDSSWFAERKTRERGFQWFREMITREMLQALYSVEWKLSCLYNGLFSLNLFASLRGGSNHRGEN